MNSRVILSLVLCLLPLFNSLAQTDFNRFLDETASKNRIDPLGAKRFLEVEAIQEQEDLNSLELDTLKSFENFFGISFILSNEQGCEIGYFVTLDPNGEMLDQIQHTYACEIDLDAQSFVQSEGELIDGFIKIIQEEEVVLDPSDTSANLNNSETELLIYNRYFQIEDDGYLIELSSPKRVSLDREYAFASQELLSIDDLKDYSKNELTLIRSEILASYGHIFEVQQLQKRYEELEWYTPIGDATSKLSDIENRNIELIDSILLK